MTYGGGVYKSTTGGDTWKPVNSGLSDFYIQDIEIAETGAIFLATKDDGVFRSESGGFQWVSVNQGLEFRDWDTDKHFYNIAISSAYATDRTVYVAMWEGLFVTHNKGISWGQADMVIQKMNRGITLSSSFETDGIIFAGTYGGGGPPFSRSGYHLEGSKQGIGQHFYQSHSRFSWFFV